MHPLLHNKNSFQYTVICLKPLFPTLYSPEVLTAPKMHGMLYTSLYKGHNRFDVLYMPSPAPFLNRITFKR